MSERNYDILIEKEFPIDQAGERVGWVHIDRPHEGHVSAHIATATVGENGGVVRKFIKPGGLEVFGDGNVEGFSHIRAMYALFSQHKEGIKLEDAQEFLPDGYVKNDREAGERLLGVSSRKDNLDQRVWTSEDVNLIQLIKNGLTNIDAAEFYPNIYYFLNGHVCRPNMYEKPQEKQDWQKLLFVDPEMHSQTQDVVETTEETLKALNDQQTENNRMLKVLTPFSDVKPEDIPQVFRESRLAVAGLEKVVMEAERSPFGNFIYLPIGFRTSGRTWPYMDASAESEDHAFGRELSALKSENIRPAQSELERELDELSLRADWASTGLRTIQELAKAEASLHS